MIFSKDKKPTEPGQFWVCDNDPTDGDGDTMEPRIVALSRYGKRGLTLDGPSLPPYGIAKQFPTALWGDRIEAPTVETPNAD